VRIDVTQTHTTAANPNAFAFEGADDHGETDVRPSPVPKVNRINANAAAPTPPANTAPQETTPSCRCANVTGSFAASV
jgi:hypothetical protein